MAGRSVKDIIATKVGEKRCFEVGCADPHVAYCYECRIWMCFNHEPARCRPIYRRWPRDGRWHRRKNRGSHV